jgi:hypothetical protein
VDSEQRACDGEADAARRAGENEDRWSHGVGVRSSGRES